MRWENFSGVHFWSILSNSRRNVIPALEMEMDSHGAKSRNLSLMPFEVCESPL